MEQRALFKFNIGSRLRDEAIKKADDNASMTWKHDATAALHRVCRRQHKLTTDDVWAELASAETPREPRAMGAIMQKAYKGGIIQPTDNWRLSNRPACHRRPLRVWEVLI